MRLATNNEDFGIYDGQFIDMTVNGVSRKFLVQKVSKFTMLTGTGLLDDERIFRYDIYGPSPIQTCCIGITALSFYICNSNAAKDDDFEIFLNNTSIGSAILGLDDQVGSIFFAGESTGTPIMFENAPFVCPQEKMQDYFFDRTLLNVDGTKNVLSAINRVTHDNGNFGTIQFVQYSVCSSVSGYTVTDTNIISSFNYSGSTGESFTFDFYYTEPTP